MKLKTRTLWVLGFAMCAFLSACSPPESHVSRNKLATGAIEQQPSIDPITALPPNSNDRPLQPGQSGTTYSPDGLPVLVPAGKGVSADQLFAEKISNDEARFKRLENAVADLRREFDAVKPAIVRLTAVESDMEELVTQLQTIAPASGAVPPPPPGGAHVDDVTPIPDIGPMAENTVGDLVDEKPQPAPRIKTENASQKAEAAEKATVTPIKPVSAKPVTVEKVPAIAPTSPVPAVPVTPVAVAVTPIGDASSAIQIKGVRVADHGTSTRIVIDASKTTTFTYNVDNSEHILMIELPGVAWQGARGAHVKSALAPSWTVSDDGKGVILAIDLAKVSVTAVSSTIPASAGAPYRIVFDLKPSS